MLPITLKPPLGSLGLTSIHLSFGLSFMLCPSHHCAFARPPSAQTLCSLLFASLTPVWLSDFTKYYHFFREALSHLPDKVKCPHCTASRSSKQSTRLQFWASVRCLARHLSLPLDSLPVNTEVRPGSASSLSLQHLAQGLDQSRSPGIGVSIPLCSQAADLLEETDPPPKKAPKHQLG